MGFFYSSTNRRFVDNILGLYGVYTGERNIVRSDDGRSDPLRFSPFSSDTRPAAAAIERGAGPLRMLIYSKRSDRHLISYTIRHFLLYRRNPHFPGLYHLTSLSNQTATRERKCKHITKSMSWVRWRPRPTVTTCELLLTGRINRL